MKPHQTFTPPAQLLAQIGEEYNGTYTVHILNAKEYLQAAEELIQAKRFEAQKKGETWKGNIPETELRNAILHASVTKDGQPLPQELPSKLYEILSFVAVPLNMLSQEEGQNLLESFRPAPKN
jgi:hypothetical protein